LTVKLGAHKKKGMTKANIPPTPNAATDIA
jgi:hypothetical protein